MIGTGTEEANGAKDKPIAGVLALILLIGVHAAVNLVQSLPVNVDLPVSRRNGTDRRIREEHCVKAI